MDAVWLCAPVPGLRVTTAAGAVVAVRPNAAASAWGRLQGLADADWFALAAQAARPAGALGEAVVDFAGQPVRVVPVALADGLLLWLKPDASPAPPEARALDRLQQAERATRFLDRALGLAGVSVWRLDLETGRIHFNATGFAGAGIAPDPGGVPIDAIRASIHPDDLDRVVRAADEAIATDRVVDVVARYRAPEGGWRTLLTRRVADRDTAGRAIGLAGISIDLSAQLRDQHERERTRWAIGAAGVGVWERDASGAWRYWNEAMYRQRGLEPTDPRPLDELARAGIPPEDAARLQRLFERHLGSAEPLRAELRVASGPGRWRWLETHGQMVRDAAGRPLGMVGVSLDATERKEAEALQREKERVEQASRDKSAFMARMSHELRTPLNAVLGFARLIEDDLQDPPSPRQRERLRQVSSAGARLLSTVDDMLDLADAEAQATPPQARTLAVAEVLDDAALSIRMLAREQRVELALPRPDAALRLVADRPRVLRALGLLLQHALARSAPGARVEIEARAAGDAGAPRVVILIRDFGPGLSAAQHLWLFESFAPEAAASGGAPAVADAGLRLSLARSLLQSMHGQVEALDGVQGGTELRVDLPGAAADPDAPPALDLLCVEDNPVNLQLVRELIALRPSMRLRTAVDGASGIAEARASPPDVMLLDLQLPDLHGVEVMRRLRAEMPAARTTFIALSADAMPDHVRAALEAGFDAYWTKPIDFGHFLAELDRMAAAAGRSADGAGARDEDAAAGA